jgi:cold shock CspA family protein
MTMVYGTVVFFNRARGWGFATPDGCLENDVFLHVSELPPDRKFLLEGERIAYEMGERNGKPLALNIRIIVAETAVRVLSTLSGAIR